MAIKSPKRSTDDPRVFCQLEQLLALAQQASHIPLNARYRPSGILAGRNHSRLRGQGLNFEELRGYRAGDSLRSVDWKASARSRQRMVKVFTEETDRPTVLLVDQRHSLFFGSKNRTKSVTAAEVAAMLGWMVLNNGDRLGGVVFNNQQQEYLKPARSKASATRIMQVICDYNNSLQPGINSLEDEITIDSVLTDADNYIDNSGTIFLISDCDGLVDDQLDNLEYLAYRHNVVVLLIVDPMEKTLSDVDLLVVSDGLRQLQLKKDKAVHERFAEQYQNQVRSIVQRIAAHGLPFGVIDTVQPIDEQLQSLFGME